MTNFKKTLKIGASKATGTVYVKVSFKYGKLSLSGVEGPYSNGSCKGGCGQIDISMDNDYMNSLTYADGWNKARLKRLKDVIYVNATTFV